MKRLMFPIIAIIGLVMFSGCASYGRYEPTVDPYGDPRADRIGQDLYECRQLALHASGDTGTQAAQGAVVGAAIGAVAGTVMGAVTGHAGHGAALGAAGGAVVGGTGQGLSAEQRYIRAYKSCMRNRGHNVID